MTGFAGPRFPGARFALLLLVSLLVCLPGAVGANTGNTGCGIEDFPPALQSGYYCNEAGNATPKPRATTVPDPVVSEELIEKHTQYLIWKRDHREKTFEWQYRSSKIIFVTVLAIVALGVLMSLMQFGVAWYRDLIGEDPRYGMHQVEGSKESVKVSSPMVGVIILAVSLAFFIAYLMLVYPIKENRDDLKEELETPSQSTGRNP